MIEGNNSEVDSDHENDCRYESGDGDCPIDINSKDENPCGR